MTTRAPRGTDRSPEYNEHFCYKLDSRVKNLTTEWNQKQQHFITHASRSLLWIRFVAVAFRSEEVFEEGEFIENSLKFLKHLNLLYKH